MKPADTHPLLPDDTLEGAAAIAQFVYGRNDRAARRKIYHLSRSSRFPIFRRGSRLCARKSVIMDWIRAQERHSTKDLLKDMFGGNGVVPHSPHQAPSWPTPREDAD